MYNLIKLWNKYSYEVKNNYLGLGEGWGILKFLNKCLWSYGVVYVIISLNVE